MNKEDKISKLGYKKSSPFLKRPQLVIDSNIITTDNMAFPILTVSDKGDSKILYPNTGDFIFEGSKVMEIPLKNMNKYNRQKKQQGGMLVKVPVQKSTVGNQMIEFDTNTSSVNPSDSSIIFVKGSDEMFHTLKRDSLGNYTSMGYQLDNVPSWQKNFNMGASTKRKSKMRFREMQKGGFLSLEDYLGSLNDEDQDKFVSEMEKSLQLNSIEDFVYKCGGKMQEGQMFVPDTKGLLPDFINAELEDGETYLSGGQLHKVEGKTHKEGGEPIHLKSGDKVFSHYLVVPEEVLNALNVGKNSKSKTSFADLSKRFDTTPQLKTLEDPESDKFQLANADLKLQNNLLSLETLFQGQEMAKNMGKKMKTTYREKSQKGYQSGGIKQPDGTVRYDLSAISDRFQPQLTGYFLDPETNNQYKRFSDGTYQQVNSEVSGIPVLEQIKRAYPGQSNVESSPANTYPVDINTLSVYQQPQSLSAHEQPQSLVGTDPISKHKPDYKWTPETGNPDLNNKPSVIKKPIRKKIEKKADVSQTTNNRTDLYSRLMNGNQDFSLLEDYDVQEPVNSGLNNLPSYRSLDPLPTISEPNPNPTAVKETKESWFKRNKDKFGINSKLAGTLLDIGMTMSDKLDVDAPPLYNRQKNPLFNRFYEFDDKEVQRMASQQISAIQNSNLPEQVKRTQIAEITANAQTNQARVDFANAQRYEQKRELDLNKLQTYIDTNKELRVQDYDNYRQRKAKVDYLRDRFEAGQKEDVYNSVRGYADYATNLDFANQTSPHFTVSPITGKVKYKPKPNQQLTDNILSQYAQSPQNTIDLGNGVTARQMGNLLIVTDKDGKVEIKELKQN